MDRYVTCRMPDHLLLYNAFLRVVWLSLRNPKELVFHYAKAQVQNKDDTATQGHSSFRTLNLTELAVKPIRILDILSSLKETYDCFDWRTEEKKVVDGKESNPSSV